MKPIDHSLDQMAANQIARVSHHSGALSKFVEDGAWVKRLDLESLKTAVRYLQEVIQVQEERLTRKDAA